MKIYVGRWALLPAEWEGYNGLSEKSEEEIKAEVSREVDIMEEDTFIAIYEPDEFEETFNQCLTRFIDSRDYWIKIF
jgi:hypothetical protein